MSGSPFSSGPSRKSRFRPQRAGEVRPPPAEGAAAAPAEPLELPETPPAEAAPPLEVEDAPQTVARPRRAPLHDHGTSKPAGANRWLPGLLGAALLAGGAGAGYFIGASGARPAATAKKHADAAAIESPPALTADELAQLDNAFQASKEAHYAQAEQMFESFSQKHPSWVKIPLETARLDIYQNKLLEAQSILGRMSQSPGIGRADAYFLLGIMNLKIRRFTDAEAAFSMATNADPTRSEFFYFWGDCLRQEGKPQEAKTHFLSAENRNQFETADDLLQLKIWLCDITMDQEKADGTSAAIDAELARPFPRAACYFAAAARSIKAERFAEAASFISRGRSALDPVVFRVVMSDPTFSEQKWRPELAPFYTQPRPAEKRSPAPIPSASPPASATQTTVSPAPPAVSPAPTTQP